MNNNQSNDFYNLLCTFFFQEERRLEMEVDEKLFRLTLERYNTISLLEYAEAKAKAQYFKDYMLELLKYLAWFQGNG